MMRKIYYFSLSVVIYNDSAFVVNTGIAINNIPLGFKILSIKGKPISEIVNTLLNYDESYTRNCFVRKIKFTIY